jgi:hypothetical protein
MDIRHLRNLEVYAISLVALTFAVLSVIGDILPDNARWAVLLAAVGVLVFRVAGPQRDAGSDEQVLRDRLAFDDTPFAARLRGASELWVFAPTGINLLSPQVCETVRGTLLASPDGAARVVVLNPGDQTAVRQATWQLDDPLDSPPQLFLASLQSTIGQLNRIANHATRGSFGYRLLDFNPGFSLVAIDPAARDGRVIVEFHGFHSETTTSRMHIELTKVDGSPWYAYWLDQFERIWRAAQEPGVPAVPTSTPPPDRDHQNLPGQGNSRGDRDHALYARTDVRKPRRGTEAHRGPFQRLAAKSHQRSHPVAARRKLLRTEQRADLAVP